MKEAKRLAVSMPAVIAMDTEYSDKDVRKARLLSVIISNGEWAYSVKPEFLSALTPTLKSRKVIFLQDYNHCDSIILFLHGCDLRNTRTYNLIDMHHLQNENLDHDLGSRVLERFRDNYKAEFWGKYKTFEEAPEDEALEYECKDGIYTYKLGMEDLGALQSKEALLEHVRRMSLALLDTEIEGVRVNVELMRKTKEEMGAQIERYLPKLRGEFIDEVTIWELKKWKEEIEKRKTIKGKLGVGKPIFSFASDKQVSNLLYGSDDWGGLNLPITNKTKTGNPSTDFETVEALSKSYPRLSTLVEYKNVKSLYGTFVEGMLDRVEQERIYPHFNVSGTDTGRINHSAPNLGNLPSNGPIRSFFISSYGCSLIGADFRQIEVVIEANLTEDKSLLKIILEGASKHDITAEGLKIDRNSAKTLNFALQYGAGAGKVSKILGISFREAEDIFGRYWELYSGVKALKEATIKKLEEEGEVTNLFGRTRHLPKAKNKFELFRQQRQAYNFLIQGVAGDACNRAFWQYHERLKKSGHGCTLFSVHDEIVAEVADQYVEEEKIKLCEIMENVSDYLGFKYRLQAKPYGPLKAWAKT